MVAPASRFSNTADTGIRVSRNTHAPLSLPGTLSTTGHCDQSRVAMFLPSPTVNFLPRFGSGVTRGGSHEQGWKQDMPASKSKPIHHRGQHHLEHFSATAT